MACHYPFIDYFLITAWAVGFYSLLAYIATYTDFDLTCFAH